LRGAADPRLLNTYDSERRPVAERTLAQALARLQAWLKDPSKKLPPAEKIIADYNVIFGYLYHSGALIPEEGLAPVVVERSGERLSTIDLFNDQWVLLAGPGGDVW
jgi:putative polyketide hydroxylase